MRLVKGLMAKTASRKKMKEEIFKFNGYMNFKIFFYKILLEILEKLLKINFIKKIQFPIFKKLF